MIDLFFAIINLVIFMFLVIYVFRNYILPLFNQSMLEYISDLQNLKNKKTVLKERQALIQVAIDLQETQCKDLLRKVTIWENAVIQESSSRALSRQKTDEELQKKMRIQSEHYYLDYTHKAVTHEVIHKLTQELKQFYQTKEHSQKYIAQIITFLEKNKACM